MNATTDLQSIAKVLEQVFSDQKGFNWLKNYQILPQLLQEMIVDQAIAPFEITPEEDAMICEKFFAKQQIEPAAQQQWLDQRGISLEEVMAPLRRSVQIEKFKQFGGIKLNPIS